MQITMKVQDLTTEALRAVAYALLEDAGICGRGRGVRIERSRQVKAIVIELESRAYGGATDELREMVSGLDTCIENQRIKPAPREWTPTYKA